MQSDNKHSQVWDSIILAFPFPQIGSCKNVTVMSLRSNKLEFLPDEIGQMQKLRVLNLSDNRYSSQHFFFFLANLGIHFLKFKLFF